VFEAYLAISPVPCVAKATVEGMNCSRRFTVENSGSPAGAVLHWPKDIFTVYDTTLPHSLTTVQTLGFNPTEALKALARQAGLKYGPSLP